MDFRGAFHELLLLSRGRVAADNRDLQRFFTQKWRFEILQKDDLFCKAQVNKFPIQDENPQTGQENTYLEAINPEAIRATEKDQVLDQLVTFASSQESEGPKILSLNAVAPSELNNSDFHVHVPACEGQIYHSKVLAIVHQNGEFLSWEEKTLETILTPIDVLLLGDPERESDQASKINLESEEWSLLLKMVKALGVAPAKIVFSRAIEKTENNSDLLANLFYHQAKILRPKIVITLGAVAINLLRQKKERLGQIHGQLFPFAVHFSQSEILKLAILPIFHPEFLLINPNMKRAAWQDLQQAIKMLGNN